MSNEENQNGQTNEAPSPPPLPAWIEAPLFEPVFREILPDFQQTKSFKVKPALAAGENYATVMLRLEAEVELKDGSSKDISLMLKTAHDTKMFREMMKSHNIFDIEATMYREVVPEFEQLYKEAGVAINFGAKSYDLSVDHPYILLEDLSLYGFKNMNRLEGLDIEHTQEVLTKLAQWHAASAVRVATKGAYQTSLRHGFFVEESRDMMKPMFEGLGKIFLNCAKSYDGVEEYYEALTNTQKNLVDELFEISRGDANDFCVLNHGDCWSNNVMFQHDAFGKIKQTFLVDYQMPRYGTLAQDLYYFLLSSTKYELKLKQFDYFIKYYCDQLIEHLKILNYPKKMPSLKDIHIALYKYSAWAYSTVTGVMAAVLLDPNESASLDNFLADNDSGTLFKMQMFSSPRYRKHMEMILPWLYNRGALKTL